MNNAPVSHPDLYPYPESLPPSLWPHLVALLRGQLPDSREAAHYAWHAAGYGLFCWAGQEPPVMLMGEPLTAAQAADLVELYYQATMGRAVLPSLPWKQIALLVLDLLRQILSQ